LPKIDSADKDFVTLEENDEALVLRCRDHGDEEAFAELVGRYRDRVFRVAASILGAGFSAEAEEVAQETFLRVHHALGTFRGEAKFGSWIYRIAFNQALNLKSRVRFRVPHLNEQALAQTASTLPDPLARVEAARLDQALTACMNELPEVYQSALRLHYWMDTSVVDIASMLDVPANTVKSYLHRARQLLQVLLKERGFGDD
jgi:RNA polymerase sigma factor (sigma-70 family)